MTMLPPDPLFVIRSEESVTTVAYGSNNHKLFSGNLSGDVVEWSMTTFRKTSQFSTSKESVMTIIVTNGNEILVQNKMGLISMWINLNNDWSELWSINVDYMGFCQLRYFQDWIISSLSSAGLQFISMTGQIANTIALWGRELSGDIMAFHPFERDKQSYMLVASERGDLGVWTIDGIAYGESLRLEEPAMTLCFDAERMRGAAGGPTGAVTIFQVRPKGVSLNRVINFPKTGIGALSLRPDQKILAVGCWDGTLKIFSWKSLVGLAVLQTHDHSVQCITFTEKAPFVFAAGCKDGRISIWDLYN